MKAAHEKNVSDKKRTEKYIWNYPTINNEMTDAQKKKIEKQEADNILKAFEQFVKDHCQLM